jgi:hypothetical protein
LIKRNILILEKYFDKMEHFNSGKNALIKKNILILEKCFSIKDHNSFQHTLRVLNFVNK